MLLWALAVPLPAQTLAEDGAAPDISLLTFGPGSLYWERYGHNALLVREATGARRVYNYGMFDFQQENFFLNFARGHMDYWLDAFPLDATLASYVRHQRWVYEQRLALTPAQRSELAAFLAWNLQPENAGYRYDYFRDNCSTRVRDALDRVLGGALRAQLERQPTATSYRSEALSLMAPQPALMLGMDILIGPRPDRALDIWARSFIPMVLMDAVRGVHLRDADGVERPLVASEGWLFQQPAPADDAVASLPAAGFLGAGLAWAALLLALGRARRVRAVLMLVQLFVCGLFGAIMAAAWAFSAHWAIWANQNLLLFSPLAWLLLPAAFRSGRRHAVPGRTALALAAMLAAQALLALLWKVSPLTPQQNLHWIALLLPAQLALAAVFWRAGARAAPAAP